MNIVEKIKTTKGCYSLTIEMVEDAEYALVSLTDSKLEHCIRLDAEDLRRIHQLIGDHIGQRIEKKIIPEFYRYLVYQYDENRNKYPFPHAEIYARDDVEAWEIWEEYAVDGPSNVCIEYKKDKQVPFVQAM